MPDSVTTRYSPLAPQDMLDEIFWKDAREPQDERLWVPNGPGRWTRPLCFNVSQGYWVHLLKVTEAGVVSRHRHPAPVHGFVLEGRWRYLERDWVATAGSYLFEPPGDVHTLVVDEGDYMITLFHMTGALLYCALRCASVEADCDAIVMCVVLCDGDAAGGSCRSQVQGRSSASCS